MHRNCCFFTHNDRHKINLQLMARYSACLKNSIGKWYVAQNYTCSAAASPCKNNLTNSLLIFTQVKYSYSSKLTRHSKTYVIFMQKSRYTQRVMVFGLKFLFYLFTKAAKQRRTVNYCEIFQQKVRVQRKCKFNRKP